MTDIERIIKQIQMVTPGEFAFSRKRLGVDEFEDKFYDEDSIISGFSEESTCATGGWIGVEIWASGASLL